MKVNVLLILVVIMGMSLLFAPATLARDDEILIVVIGKSPAYYWTYALPREPVTEPLAKEEIRGAEDISHASLTASFPIMLASEGKFFTREDMEWMGLTVVNGFARLDNGVLFGNVVGEPAAGPGNVQLPGRWLRLSPFAPDVYNRIAEFYLKYRPTPHPLALALLIRQKDAVSGS